MFYFHYMKFVGIYLFLEARLKPSLTKNTPLSSLNQCWVMLGVHGRHGVFQHWVGGEGDDLQQDVHSVPTIMSDIVDDYVSNYVREYSPLNYTCSCYIFIINKRS